MKKTPKLPLFYYGHSILRQKALPIEKITPEIVQLATDMIDSMIAYDNSIGLSGNQVGVLLRIFVIREEIFHQDGSYSLGPPEVFINPVLSNPSPEIEVMQEGCMSLPKIYPHVPRPKSIHISYQNIKGERVEEDVRDFRARMLMHENDHLNGVLTVDRADPKERKKLEPLLQAVKKKYNA